MARFSKNLVPILFSCLLFCTTTSSENSRENELPKFYFISKLHKCPLDSPELYYEDVALASFASIIQEGRILFGVFMDNLEGALSESDEFEGLKEKWEYFTKTMSENFDLKANRIDSMWDKVIGTYEATPLPWEVSSRRVVLYEIFCGLHYEYLILEAMIRSGVKEIVGTLQGTFGKVVKKLGETMADQGEGDPDDMMKQAEQIILEVEPNFVGRLLSRMLKNGRKLKESLAQGRVEIPRTFLSGPLEQVGIVIEAYREKSQDYPNDFWKQMVMIMRHDSTPESGDHIYAKYSQSEESLTKQILNFVAVEAHVNQ